MEAAICCSRIGRAFTKNRSKYVIIRVSSHGGFPVCLQQPLHELMAREQGIERRVARIRDGGDWGGIDGQLRLVSLEQGGFEPRVQPGLPRQLAVVVIAGVQRHVRVLNVMAGDGGKQHGVAGSIGGAALQKPSNARRRLPNSSASRHGSMPIRFSASRPNFSTAAP